MAELSVSDDGVGPVDLLIRLRKQVRVEAALLGDMVG
jgi:hypothetical protein